MSNIKSKILPAVLIISYVLFIIMTWGKWGNIIYDCFQEAVLPQEILKGKVLYSDINCIYPPFAYYVNAFLYKIFGVSLNTLYWASIICIFFMLSELYKLIKSKSSEITAFITILTILEIFVFRIEINSSASWIFPYSYSFLYAFISCIFAFCSFIIYKDLKQEKFLYLTFLLTGLSAAFKWDFLVFIVVPIFEVIKNKSIKQLLIGALAFLIPNFISLGIFFHKGGTFSDIIYLKSTLACFSKVPSVALFNKINLIQYFDFKILKILFTSFFVFIVSILALGIFVYYSITLIKKVHTKPIKIFSGFALLIICYCIVITLINQLMGKIFALDLNLMFIPYFDLLIAIYILWRKFKKGEALTEKENFFLITTFAGFCIIYRQITAVDISYIGNFTIILHWIAFVYFWLEILPQYNSCINEKQIKITLLITIALFGFSYTNVYLQNAEEMNTKIGGNKGVIYALESDGNTINKALEYINSNISPEKTLLATEEGLIFNYFSERQTDLKYYKLIPHLIETYGEDNIIEAFTKNPPDYIILTNNEYSFIGRFGINYARKIIQYVYKNYDLKQEILPNSQYGLAIQIYGKK